MQFIRTFRDKYWMSPGVPFNSVLLAIATLVWFWVPQGRDLILVDGEDRTSFWFGLITLSSSSWWFSRLAFNAANTDRGSDDWHLLWHSIPILISSLWMGLGAFALYRSIVPAILSIIVAFILFLIVDMILDRGDREREQRSTTGQGTEQPSEQSPKQPSRPLQNLPWLQNGFSILIILLSIIISLTASLNSSVLIMLMFSAIIGIVTYIRIIDELWFRISIISFCIIIFSLTLGIFGHGNNDTVGGDGKNKRTFKESGTATLAEEYDLWSSQWSKEQPRTMILVASQGGASRAAAWTGAVLSEFDRLTDGRARDHVFAINAVSGGSLGAAGYVAHVALGTKPSDMADRIEQFTGYDFLAPTLTATFTTDLLERFNPTEPMLIDRATALETSWEEGWDASCPDPLATTPDHTQSDGPDCHGLFGRPFLELRTPTRKRWVPLLIVQGASLETGRRILTSPVEFDSKQVDADNFYTLVDYEISVSTAIHNGARFPYISPAGVVPKSDDSKEHIVDGGYFDATGVETIRELGEALSSIAKEKGEVLSIYYLIIRYDQTHEKSVYQIPNEVIGPILALLYSRDGHSDHSRNALKRSVNDAPGRIFEVVLLDCFEGCSGDNGYRVPMNWVLSPLTKDHISRAATEPFKENSAQGSAPAPNAVIQGLVNSAFPGTH